MNISNLFGCINRSGGRAEEGKEEKEKQELVIRVAKCQRRPLIKRVCYTMGRVLVRETWDLNATNGDTWINTSQDLNSSDSSESSDHVDMTHPSLLRASLCFPLSELEDSQRGEALLRTCVPISS